MCSVFFICLSSPKDLGRGACCITPNTACSIAAETAKLMQDHIILSIYFPVSANSALEQSKTCSPFPG